jgi:hypothetical protein
VECLEKVGSSGQHAAPVVVASVRRIQGTAAATKGEEWRSTKGQDTHENAAGSRRD